MSEFVAHLLEVFAPFAALQAKRMFGGYGLFNDGLMIGLVADDTLYLKADAQSRPLFLAEGLSAFEYSKKGKPMQLSYFTAPEEIHDDPDAMMCWAKRAMDAAVRSRKPPRKVKRSTRDS